jgi:hypothetical protein
MEHETRGLGHEILSIDNLFRRPYGKTYQDAKMGFTKRIRRTPNKGIFLFDITEGS